MHKEENNPKEKKIDMAYSLRFIMILQVKPMYEKIYKKEMVSPHAKKLLNEKVDSHKLQCWLASLVDSSIQKVEKLRRKVQLQKF